METGGGEFVCLCEHGDGRWRGRDIVGPNGTVLVQSGERSCGDGDLLAGRGKGISQIPSTSNSAISSLVPLKGLNTRDPLWVRGKLFKKDSRARQRRWFGNRSVTMRLCRLGTSDLARFSGNQETMLQVSGLERGLVRDIIWR